uniref:Uncharacterized protein n=2 Tax=Strongyloides stercoralis TaxID=6248 RepID=A0A0K0EBB9_STRER
MNSLKIQLVYFIFFHLFSFNIVLSFWFPSHTCGFFGHFTLCPFCYGPDNEMYFLSQIPFNDRCGYTLIENNRNIPKNEILRQQDEYMSKYSEVAKKRYEEYKKHHEELEKSDKERLDSKANRLSLEAKQLYDKIYSVIYNDNVTLLQEYKLCHTIINEAKFKNVVEASELIPARYFADSYDNEFVFHIHDDPFECHYC